MESTPRLKAAIFVRALIRRAEVAGASAFIVRKGAEDAGAVILRPIRSFFVQRSTTRTGRSGRVVRVSSISSA